MRELSLILVMTFVIFLAVGWVVSVIAGLEKLLLRELSDIRRQVQSVETQLAARAR